ncbi:unnamed protein product [Moneuplotes crassus]|uniref:Uncharacterized protein n=1 Tax=Euplotes crassus TaxID=5936 RepID=A0AAD1XPJ4_EUPCR|nr:unnamed protein product [Moneuplotes crassus]
MRCRQLWGFNNFQARTKKGKRMAELQKNREISCKTPKKRHESTNLLKLLRDEIDQYAAKILSSDSLLKSQKQEIGIFSPIGATEDCIFTQSLQGDKQEIETLNHTSFDLPTTSRFFRVKMCALIEQSLSFRTVFCLIFFNNY